MWQVSGFLMGLSVIGSIFNITGIAINRYCYICHSFSYDKLYSYRNTLLLVVLIWVLTILAIVPNFFVGSLQYDPRVYSCTFAQTVSTSYTITVVVVHFFVPIAVVTFCYLRIFLRLRRRRSTPTYTHTHAGRGGASIGSFVHWFLTGLVCCSLMGQGVDDRLRLKRFSL